MAKQETAGFTRLYFGNSDVVEVEEFDDPKKAPVRHKRKDLGKTRTVVHLPGGLTLMEKLNTITAEDGVWARHSDSAPGWVASDDDKLADIFAAHFGVEKRKLLVNGERGEFADDGLTPRPPTKGGK